MESAISEEGSSNSNATQYASDSAHTDEAGADLSNRTGRFDRIPLEATAAIGSVGDPESVRSELVDRRIIHADDWSDAVKKASSATNVRAIVGALREMPARWSVGTDEVFTALTQYQADQILSGKTERLRLQHYVLLDRLGAGGMGEVFRARNLNLPRLEAVKTILQSESGGNQHTKAADLERFQREAQLLAQLNHRYITTVHHAGRDRGINFIAMEFIKGQDLRKIVEQAKETDEPVPIWWAVEKISAAAEALQHAHEHDVVHRDVKPQNIMILPNGEVKVLDMGIARLAGPKEEGSQPKLTQDGTGLGTPDVMPPEQWADAASVTPASDIYSLGCTFFFILTGEMPFVASSVNELMFMHFNDERPKPSDLRHEIPNELDQIICKMIAKEISDRYSNCKEVIDALKPLRKKGSMTQTIPSMVVKEPEPARGVALTAGIAIAAVALVIASYFVISNLNKKPLESDEQKQVATTNTTDTTTTLQSAEDIEKIRRETEAKGEIRRKIDLALNPFHIRYPDVWKDEGAVRSFADSRVPFDNVTKDGQIGEITRAVESETWKRKSDQWIAGFQQANPAAWPQPDDIQKVVAAAFSNGISNQADLEKAQEIVRNETKILIQKRISEALDALVAANPEIWVDGTALVEESNRLLTDRPAVDDKSFAEWKQSVDELTTLAANPFQGVAYKVINEEREDWRAATVLHAYRWLASLASSPPDPDAKLEVRAVINGQPVSEVKVEQSVTVQLKPAKAGYVTLLVFGSDGAQVLARRTTPLEAGVWQDVNRAIAATEGTDLFVCFITDTPPFDGFPRPPADVERAKVFLDGPLFILRNKEQVARLEDSFRSKLQFARIVDHLKSGKPLLGAGTNSKVKWWNRAALEIRVVK